LGDQTLFANVSTDISLLKFVSKTIDSLTPYKLDNQELGSFLFMSCRQRWPRQVKAAQSCLDHAKISPFRMLCMSTVPQVSVTVLYWIVMSFLYWAEFSKGEENFDSPENGIHSLPIFHVFDLDSNWAESWSLVWMCSDCHNNFHNFRHPTPLSSLQSKQASSSSFYMDSPLPEKVGHNVAASISDLIRLKMKYVGICSRRSWLFCSLL
jgi:hypothetical protein